MEKSQSAFRLEQLQRARNRADLARALRYKPQSLSYILYRMQADKRYTTFDIPKKSGGSRTIHKPNQRLRQLQKNLSDLLYDCVDACKEQNPGFWYASHGFQRRRKDVSKTVITNARRHKNRRFVFNIDLEDFFGTINFGRVRGFFIKDRHFQLNPKVATIIAQIAFHNNALPQGSPCSPVISNLVGNILDMPLIALAKKTQCTYTRYADDITFSTNQIEFPSDIALNVSEGQWEVGEELIRIIKKCGFKINPAKTRMSLRQSRQTVTGLVVNEKVNISQDYYRTTRLMCHSLFRTGSYHPQGDTKQPLTQNLRPLEGRLSYIYSVKYAVQSPPSGKQKNKYEYELKYETGDLKAPKELLRKFLFYQYFVALDAPLIVTEGKTDITYLQCAMRSLASGFPKLVKQDDGKEDGKLVRRVRFFRPSRDFRDLLGIVDGSSGLARLIQKYKSALKPYRNAPMRHPVILVCDNDAGLGDISSAAKQHNVEITKETKCDFYHLRDNLYVVKIPEDCKPGDVESLFPEEVLQKQVKGRSFSRECAKGNNGCDSSKYFDKKTFAQEVVRADPQSIDFSRFSSLLERIDSVISHYHPPDNSLP